VVSVPWARRPRAARAGRCEVRRAEEAATTKVLTVPLKRGRSQNVIAQNIGALISEGYPREQAAAIAHDYAKRSNKGKKK